MKLNEHERARPSLAGLVSSSQQSELKLLLAGVWPPLRPLPVFKYESPEYRASIEFDKGRGEWVCRKTFLPSNKVEESRGGLAELTKALPQAWAEALGECPATAHQREEFAREASRRLQTILEWKTNFENGALFSDLQGHLSESQQQEIDDILRLTLTARQLQFTPKNVASVFDALSKAGGRLATLLEIAHRKSILQSPEPPANVRASTPEAVLSTPVTNGIPPAIEDPLDQEEVESVFPAEVQAPMAEPPGQSAPQAAVSVPPGNFDAGPASLAMEFPEEAILQNSLSSARRQVRVPNLDAPASRTMNRTHRMPVLEISGVHIAAFAVVFLFAIISLPIGLTVGRGPLGQWFRDIQQSLFAGHAVQPPLPEHAAVETTKSLAPPPPAPFVDSDHYSGINTPGSATLVEEKPRELGGDPESSNGGPPTFSKPLSEPESMHPVHPDAMPAGEGPATPIARGAPPSALPVPARSFEAAGAARRASKNHASNHFTPSVGASSRRSTPSGILVTNPAHGSKPFRVNFPEKPIAASSSFAMASELSVLVPPDPGTSGAHPSSRLKAGELAYFVWPRYSRQGERYGSAETVRVRATIGQSGQVLDIKLLSGSAGLFPAARNAVHLWRYRPTLLNGRPIAVQQDITIEFRPPQYLSQVRTQHSAHN